MIYEDKKQLQNEWAKIIELDGNDVRILDETRLKSGLIDDLNIRRYLVPSQATQEAARWLIRRTGVAWELCLLRFSLFMRQWDKER